MATINLTVQNIFGWLKQIFNMRIIQINDIVITLGVIVAIAFSIMLISIFFKFFRSYF